MKTSTCAAFCLFGAFAIAQIAPGNLRAAQSKPLLVTAATVKIPDAKGSFDFIQIDPGNRRLLACHTKEGTLDVIDLDKRTVLARVPTGAAQDVAADQKTGKYFVTVSDKKQVAIVDARTLKITNTVPTAGELDGILLDARNRRVYAAHDHGKSVWVIDADAEKIVATVEIPGDPEVFVYDAAKDRVYLNIIPTNEAVVIDPKSSTVVGHWPTQPAQRPHGLALDEKTHRLFSAGANGELALIDTNNGKLIASAKIAQRVDQIAFDPGSRRLYAAADGVLTVLQETKEGIETLGDFPVPKAGKNVAVDTATQTVWTMSTDGKDSFAHAWRMP